MNAPAGNPLLTVTGLRTHFETPGGGLLSRKLYVRAVDGVDFTLERGKTLGLVGESGSGKTTAGRTILGLIPATSGKAVFDGVDLFSLSPKRWREMRKRMQIIFQDPMSSLNPRMTVASIVGEPLAAHGSLSRKQRKAAIGELLERVGLSANYMNRYPHEFSGGQRQRIGIARSLASKPDFIVCDEPVSALDVSIQAQILNLLSDLQRDLRLTYLFIAHNLAVVEHFADTVAVMYLGKIVEIAGRDSLYARPTHPYTQALLSAIPVPDPERTIVRQRLAGDPPSPVSPPSGCPFHPRCAYTREVACALSKNETASITSNGEVTTIVARCMQETPMLTPLKDDPGHCHACVLK